MVIDKMFTNSRILEKALDAAYLRNEVISNNIANVDTPNFKKKTVKFEEMLQNAMDGNNSLVPGAIDNIDPQVETNMENLSYRLDGNNVDIDTEMADMAKNTLKYDTLIASMNNQFSRLKTVLKSN